MKVYRHTETVVTDASGAADQDTSKILNGRLIAIRYVKTDYADGVDFTITTKSTGQTIWSGTDVNAAVTVVPRQPTEDNAGAASLYAAGGEPVEDYYRIADEEINIVIASGGNAKTGAFTFIVEGE